MLPLTQHAQYSIKKPKFFPALASGQWEQIVSKLDSALNEWHHSVPNHREFLKHCSYTVSPL